MITKTRSRCSDLSEFFSLNDLPKLSVINRQNKQKLVEMAKNGEDSPGHRKRNSRETREMMLLSSVLYLLTSPRSKHYCLEFHNELKEIRPDWFMKQSDLNKQKLFEMANNGEDKPKSQSSSPSYPRELFPLGRFLSRLTSPKSKYYCPESHNKLKEIRPDWFIKLSDSKKQKLIEMANNGEDRPKTKSVLGSALSRYTNEFDQHTFDSEFNDTIRELRPDWFNK